MTIEPGDAGASGIIQRVQNILLKPQSEWDRIAAEPADVNKLYLGYVLPLAAISAVAMFIGWTFIGYSAFGLTVRPSLATNAITAISHLAVTMIGIYLIAVVANALAPNFGSTQDQGQAHKLMAYSFTASLLSGIFTVVPALSILGLLGLYSFVLLYIGLPRLMKTPEDKRVGYFATLVIVGIVVFLCTGAVTGAVRGAIGGLALPGLSGSQSAPSRIEGQVQLPGGGSVDLSELEKMGQAYSQGGAAQAADPTRLQERLPQVLPGGFERVSLSSGAAMGTSQAEAQYRNGDASMTVTIVSMGAMGAMASVAAGMNVQENRQDEDGFARTRTVDGRVYVEEVSNSAGSAKYAVIGRGVAVTAEGRGGVGLDQTRAAVDVLDVPRLEQMFAQAK